MRLILGIWLFYKKIFVPAMAVAVILTLLDLLLTRTLSLYITGFSFIMLAPVSHFILYEFSNPGQYYFYHNLGLNKISLWTSTIVISFIIGIILFAI